MQCYNSYEGVLNVRLGINEDPLAGHGPKCFGSPLFHTIQFKIDNIFTVTTNYKYSELLKID